VIPEEELDGDVRERDTKRRRERGRREPMRQKKGKYA
jgi:hypothetical protein